MLSIFLNAIALAFGFFFVFKIVPNVILMLVIGVTYITRLVVDRKQEINHKKQREKEEKDWEDELKRRG